MNSRLDRQQSPEVVRGIGTGEEAQATTEKGGLSEAGVQELELCQQ